jgi:hypothetical protein
MLKSSASTPLAAASSQYSTAVTITGGRTATSHATMPWRRSPPLNERSSEAAHAESVADTLRRSPSGRHCSISRAAMMARMLMPAFYAG